MTVSAQDAFKAMMAEQVAPALRAIGFKGSGQLYIWPSKDVWALIGFQKSKWSDVRELQFTINLSIGSKTAWAEARAGREHWMPERPTPNMRCGPPMWEERIGRLLPELDDKWWSVPADSDTTKVAQEIVNVIRDVAVPAILERLGGAPE